MTTELNGSDTEPRASDQVGAPDQAGAPNQAGAPDQAGTPAINRDPGASRDDHECQCDGSPTVVAEELRDGLAASSVAVSLLDENLRNIWSNQATDDLLDAPVDEVSDEIQRKGAESEWLFFDAGGDRYDLMAALGHSLELRTPMSTRVVGTRRPDGVLLWADLEAIPVAACQCGASWHLVLISTDLTERRFAEQILHRLAFSDPLTGLANRSVLEDRLAQALLRTMRSEVPVSLFYLDLDRFKPVNDEIGHEAGDKVLRVIASRLNSSFRPEDTVARIGGDEFAVLCEVPIEGQDTLERIRTALELPITFSVDGADHEVSIGISIGHAEAQGKLDGTDLLRAADHSMYEDKHRRNPASPPT
ncbi:MAG TPA: GGDEF domain-containing protein [Solirubrobacterales bacterium]|nr:GGDEF domain-containing protein [Solirubrobacterales bacterium]